jgi:hypothetical protein
MLTVAAGLHTAGTVSDTGRAVTTHCPPRRFCVGQAGAVAGFSCLGRRLGSGCVLEAVPAAHPIVHPIAYPDDTYGMR